MKTKVLHVADVFMIAIENERHVVLRCTECRDSVTQITGLSFGDVSMIATDHMIKKHLEDLYPCCKCCEPQVRVHAETGRDHHVLPCPEGCNDPCPE